MRRMCSIKWDGECEYWSEEDSEICCTILKSIEENYGNHNKPQRLNPGSPKKEEQKATTEPQHSVFKFYFKWSCEIFENTEIIWYKLKYHYKHLECGKCHIHFHIGHIIMTKIRHMKDLEPIQACFSCSEPWRM